jgi:hypothetical protein
MNQICGVARLDEADGEVGVGLDEGGTGSCPEAPSGWQRDSRRTASPEPRITPNRATASAA